MKHLIASLVAAIVLLACGGGGDAAPEAQPAPQPQPAVPQLQEGLHLGKNPYNIDAFGRQSSVLVLENHEAWALVTGVFFGHGTFEYSGATTTTTTTTTVSVTGAVTTSTASNTITKFTDGKALVAFQSSNLGELAMTLRTGTVPSYPPGGDPVPVVWMDIPSHPQWVLPGVNPVTSATYDYNKHARLEDIAGAWGTLTIGSTGLITGTSSNGCTLIGTLSPRPSGKNVFNMTVTSAGCAAAATYNGVAVPYMDYEQYDPSGPFVPKLRLMGFDEAHTKMIGLTFQR